ncbi:MAG TPA: hypothetical protein VN887_17465 [Candidatus Angelobacter sp.]|nr:hypothetical protein [Candidatus Angelobacter sp.]
MTTISSLFKLAIASAALIPFHFFAQDRSLVHVALQLAAATVFLVTLGWGWSAARKESKPDERRSKYFEPSLLALAGCIVHGLCTPIVYYVR